MIAYNYVSVTPSISTLMLDVSHAIEVFSAMFAGGVRLKDSIQQLYL